ncbi:hypothetical protein AV540_20000 [Brevibacillus parabrevis]|uniref:hypothetical protein n=1 Tax=Brevibacillus parabrevis TaxID=54914 RepID=UPI0007AB27A4|nr:hypothetical protein [Brevibacillus parabrevis]KZE47090.1 hypothetical protein AV540_20000 [Brevibacillus parabrevis]
MKKTLVLFLMFCMFLIPSAAFANSSTDQEPTVKEPTAEEIAQLNEALDKLIIEANKKLEAGETDLYLEENVGETDGSVSLSFSLNDTKQKAGLQALAVKPKAYRATVGYSGIGFDFQHELGGTFTYEDGKIKGATKDVALTGLFYSESHNTWIDYLDPSVWVVNSEGLFKALKYGVEYKTSLVVGLYGSGDYRILQANVGN